MTKPHAPRAAAVEEEPPAHILRIQVSEDEAADLVAGVVPTTVRAMAKFILDQDAITERLAGRPYRQTKRKQS